jgi:hypothetical protein
MAPVVIFVITVDRLYGMGLKNNQLYLRYTNILFYKSQIYYVSSKEFLGNEYKFLVNEPHSVCAWINTILKTIFLSCEERSNYINTLKERVIKTYNKEASVKVIEDIMTFE